jgi:hypothetical protein
MSVRYIKEIQALNDELADAKEEIADLKSRLKHDN